MLFSSDRTEIRRAFQAAWHKYRERKPLEPLEAIIVDVVALHPEYHRWIEREESLDKDWLPEAGETNPFLHMGMHIAIHEQIATDRPAGIAAAYHAALTQTGDAHAVQHRFVECLGEVLWQAQRNGTAPDETAYLQCLRRR
jgi:hypothetical protein